MENVVENLPGFYVLGVACFFFACLDRHGARDSMAIAFTWPISVFVMAIKAIFSRER